MQAPAAVHLLSLCAYFAPDDIPRRILLSGAHHTPAVALAALRDSRALSDAISVLTRYSLLEVQGDALGVHRVHQMVVRERLDAEWQRIWAEAAARIVLDWFPEDPDPTSEWPWAARLIPHVARAIDHIEKLDTAPLVAVELRLRSSRYLANQGRLLDAESSLHKALAQVTSVEPASRLHATVLNHLAGVERELGRFNPAKVRAREALALHRSIAAPPSQPDIEFDRDITDEPSLSAADARQAIASSELQPDRDIADDLRNLGTIAQRQGEPEEAVRLIAEARTMMEQLFGAAAAEVAPVLEDLIEPLLDQERWLAVVEVLHRALTIRRETGGGESLEARVDDFLLKLLIEPDNAVPRSTELAEYLENNFGEVHPQTAMGHAMLGTVLRRVGELDRARTHLSRAVDIHRAIFGPRHYRVAAGELDLAALAVFVGNGDEAERRFRAAMTIVLAAPETEREAILRMSGLGATLNTVAADDASRSFIRRAIDIVDDCSESDPTLGAAVRRMAARAHRSGGDLLLAAKRYDASDAEYELGLELALLTDTPLDDAEFMVRQGFVAAFRGDRERVDERLRRALACLAEGGVRSPIWHLLTECGRTASHADGWTPVRPAIDALFDHVQEDGAVTEHQNEITAAVPEGWFVKESTTLIAPDGQANIIASSEPLDPSIDTNRYAEVQGELLRQEFPEYAEQSFEQVEIFGDRVGYLRSFEWTPPDGVRVAQIQLYYAEANRGYTATATTPATNLLAVEPTLVEALRGLRLSRRAAPPGTA